MVVFLFTFSPHMAAENIFLPLPPREEGDCGDPTLPGSTAGSHQLRLLRECPQYGGDPASRRTAGRSSCPRQGCSRPRHLAAAPTNNTTTNSKSALVYR
jgi:hypothetical protein